MRIPSVLFLVMLSTQALAAAAPVKFKSVTTPLYPSKKCKYLLPGTHEGDDSLKCPAKGPYRVEEHFAAVTTGVEIHLRDAVVVQFLSDETPPKLEWRMAGKTPFAVITEIVQGEYVRDEPDERAFKVQVRGLKGFESISGEFESKNDKDAWKKARALADEGYRKLAPAAN